MLRNTQAQPLKSDPISMSVDDYAALKRKFDQFAAGQHFPEQPAGLYQPISYMMSLGGKRIRPIFVMLASEMFDETVERALPAAYGIELFHNYTLIHDDIMDKADKRRGKPTVHKTYGLNAGILSGDLTMILAYSYLLRSGSELVLLPMFNEAARQICEGQQLDMDFEEQDQVAYTEYLEMIRLKTAVLLGVSLRVGGTIAGASELLQEKLYQIGENLGISFQLQDDWLDAFGKKEKVGKKIGGDILRNKKTGLLIKAREMASPEDRSELDTWMSDNEESSEKIDAVLKIMDRSGAKHFVEQEVAAYYQKAVKLLDELPLPSFKKTTLRSLAEMLYGREA